MDIQKIKNQIQRESTLRSRDNSKNATTTYSKLKILNPYSVVTDNQEKGDK